ncbi:MAG: response regulator [bacterium]|jgi:DNA-binding NtrC family response regulator|nr:response regulator [bacterium]
MKILIVDDKKNVRTSLSIGLKREGFDVDVAGSAFEAIDKIKVVGYDVMLSDVRMPDMNGFELANKIAKLSPRIQTILMSAYNFKDYEERYQESNQYSKISKPFEMSELLNLLPENKQQSYKETVVV